MIDYRNIEQDTLKNKAYRRVVYTVDGTKKPATRGMQLVLMSLAVGESIPCEVHGDIGAQFIRIESGRGQLTINDQQRYTLTDGIAVTIPNGTRHCIENIDSKRPLKLYSIYTPPEHATARFDARQPAPAETAPASVSKKRKAAPATTTSVAAKHRRHRMMLRSK